MPISQERMIRLAKAGEALMRQLDAMRQMMETARGATAEGDFVGAMNVLDTAIIQCHPQRSVMEPIVLELAHFKRTAERNTKHMLKMQTHRSREALGFTEPPKPRQGRPASTEPPKGPGFQDTLFIPPPSVGRVATPQGPEFARIAEGPLGAEPLPPRQPPTLSALGVRGTGDRADVVTSVPDDVNATPELGDDPFARPLGGGVAG